MKCPTWRLLWVVFALAVPMQAQTYTQRGFIETPVYLYPEKAPNDSTRLVAQALARYEGFFKPFNSLQVNGAVDLRLDSHRETEASVSWWDRERRRPALSIRRLSAVFHTSEWTFEAGKQFIRWGKADILNPTDRFAPRDYLAVVDDEFLGVTAARLTYERGADTLEAVFAPRMTPSRIPLAGQRWVVIPPNLPADLEVQEAAPRFPTGSQSGIRWNHVGLLEFSASYYQGFNHLPAFDSAVFAGNGQLHVEIQRVYPQMRMLGMDAAVPLRWFTLKTENAYFKTSDPRADEYAQYVIQLERHSGEWVFAGGYAGEAITAHGSRSADFAPDRGLTRTFLGTARYTIDVNRSVAFEAAMRQNAKGEWLRAEYSQSVGAHWRATADFSLIRGAAGDFLGQYRLNSHARIILRYSF